MKDITKRYTNGEITVVWQPGQCIHSRICFSGLFDVFDPRKRPWINMDGADSARIMAQVDKCPSGALSYYRNSEQADEARPTVETNTVVEVMKNGPLLVYGNITVKNKEGQEEHKHKVTAFCRCGASANKPFCDGSHVRTGFRDE